MTDRTLSYVLPGVVGGIAGALAASFFLNTDRPGLAAGNATEASTGRDAPAETTARLRSRVDDVEQRLDGLAALAPVDRQEATGTRGDAAALVDRLDALEARLATIEKSARAAEERGRADGEALLLEAMARRGRRGRMDEDTARAAVLDVTKTEEEKLEAWRALRSAEEWGDAVVAEMIRVAETSESADIRADVWRQADGRDRNTMLVDPLLRALQFDRAANVRSEAAETLANYLAEPGVKDALTHAAANDENEDVRDEAQSSLERR